MGNAGLLGFMNVSIVLLVIGWQGLRHRLDSAFEFGQVVIDGGLQNRVVCVEVTVSQVIAHARDLGPGDARLRTEHLGRQAFTASPISSSRIRTASNTRPSDRSPRCWWERMASMAA